jgi:hypothetical protein
VWVVAKVADQPEEGEGVVVVVQHSPLSHVVFDAMPFVSVPRGIDPVSVSRNVRLEIQVGVIRCGRGVTDYQLLHLEHHGRI